MQNRFTKNLYNSFIFQQNQKLKKVTPNVRAKIFTIEMGQILRLSIIENFGIYAGSLNGPTLSKLASNDFIRKNLLQNLDSCCNAVEATTPAKN